MIGWRATGLPLPVGAPFRQRTIHAEHPAHSALRREGYRVPWTVSVVDTRRGPMVEAWFFWSPQALVADHLGHHSHLDDVLAQVRPLLDSAEGWTAREVQPCPVEGCSRPLPMWSAVVRNRPLECLACATRTVLACAECGAPDAGTWVGRERLLADGLCLECAHWRKRVADPPQVVTDTWAVYGIGRGGGPASAKGFGGAKWVVTFHDGRVVNTDDLWSGGEVPEWFRDRIHPNAAVAHAPRPGATP